MAPLAPGYRLVFSSESSQAVASGSVALIPSETLHAYAVEHPQRTPCFFIHLRYAMACQGDLLSAMDLPPVITGAAARRVVDHMQELHGIGPAPGSLVASARQLAYGFALLAELATVQGDVGCMADLQASVRLLPAIRCIDEQLDRAISIADLGRALGCSSASVHRLFRTYAGTSPMRFVWQRRLAAARDRLLLSDESISAIADACGFADPYHFSRAFKKRYALAPSAFRHGYRHESG